ncbi:MAG: tRNA (adenosine(37)-N6)-dimethylallyltransferase MiaA [Proteobacteria bacterium]|nr:tRNA (adenosine(37)-N6)-dimethylallyltransferase MiaA [Pseudomonadota bacterium]
MSGSYGLAGGTARRVVVVVAGPTASGKSALALTLAEAFDGIVINADSMQVYDALRILTSRPSAADEARSPHRLYGVLPAAETCSAARWRALAVDEITAAHDAGRLPIVTGGTGLYIRALIEGLAPIPEIDEAIRQRARALHATLGGPVFHDRLAALDGEMAARLAPGDSQRMIRAFEVIEATGRSLAEWQRLPAAGGGLAQPALSLVLSPPREALYAACDGRFAAMIEAGALDEVRALDSLGLDSAAPVMKALGVRPLRRHLTGESSLGQAIAAAQQATRNYAKRQVTWFRHQIARAVVYDRRYSPEMARDVIAVTRRFLLTE